MGMDDWRRFEARGIAVKERRGGIAGVQAPVGYETAECD